MQRVWVNWGLKLASVAHELRAPATLEDRQPAAEPNRIWRFLGRRQVLVALAVLALAVAEMRTSWLQSRVLSSVARQLTFSVSAGASPAIRYPRSGPYDQSLGYSELPAFLDRLERRGYRVDAQARISPLMLTLTSFGVSSIYQEKTQAGLKIYDDTGLVMFQTRYPQRVYRGFDEIPPLVVHTLLFIENREILDEDNPYRNPSVEWDRLSKAVLDLGWNQIDSRHAISGGSTLATQLEKLRHSPGGRTDSPAEKLRQMLAASLRAYRDGYQTVGARKRIVTAYLNSIPLAAAPGWGEVRGLGDGLWAWYGADFETVNRLLDFRHDMIAGNGLLAERSFAYRQVLSLLLALRRPTEFLVRNPAALDARVDAYLRLLGRDGIITPEFRDAVLRARVSPSQRAPERAPVAFAYRKATDGVRVDLMKTLGLPTLYELDRLDLTARTTLDGDITNTVTDQLQRFADTGYAGKAGLTGYRLLDENHLDSVIYSFTLYERRAGFNLLRIQSDNYNQPLNINEGTRLELGSTAKLRTLIHYLEIVSGLHSQYAALSADELRLRRAAAQDRLTRWTLEYLGGAEDKSLPAVLEAAMNRHYSASPSEAFFTGGGLHYFSNFDSKDNHRVMTAREAFQRSVNLVFIRLMRDLVQYHMYRLPYSSPAILDNDKDPGRHRYLARWADREGRQFLGQFYRKYSGLNPGEALDKLIREKRPSLERLAVIHRSARPETSLEEFTTFLRTTRPELLITDSLAAHLYGKYGPGKFNWNDRGYLARVHPLDLWLLAYLNKNPKASWQEVVVASTAERQQAYEWLFQSKYKQARDKRIQILIEQDAFAQIHEAWKRLGYPFHNLTPSYAAAIGSSGDNPAALAELMGIVANEGFRYPVVKARQLHFAEGTPMETVMVPEADNGHRVLAPEVARLVKQELIGVVEHGTGRRAAGGILLSDHTRLAVGGKTGTGDNRFETYAPGGQVISSRVINRTATFVFLIGDRFFGTITAFVPGQEAAGFQFTSALPVQAFKHLVDSFLPLLERRSGTSASSSQQIFTIPINFSSDL